MLEIPADFLKAVTDQIITALRNASTGPAHLHIAVL